MTPDLERLVGALAREARNGAARDSHLFPHFSEHCRWRLLAADQASSWRGEDYEHGNWTFGFWFGLMWLAARTGIVGAADAARDRLPVLAPRAADRTTHDLGFIFWPSLVLGNRLGYVSDREIDPARVAARTLAERFNDRGGYIQAFGPVGHQTGAGTSTIDTMMNLPLLWWAGTANDQGHLREVAHRHARTSRATFFRDDGSTYHLNRFDPRTGALLEQGTFQGAGSRSCWSRGQAWAVCGFALAYAATGDAEMLAAAEHAADYFWGHLPADSLPPWDFGVQDETAPRDASAGAIAGLGALVLAGSVPLEASRRANRARARELLTALARHVNPAEDVDGILQHASYSIPHGTGLDGATAWGDFYFTLAYLVLADRLPLETLLDGPRTTARRPAGEGASSE
ncbi:glucuronyl hydrolase [Georgenia sp. AZ-5]|uniref:glucuronyl hydrolase n=1 Tax=Georgenia sp. AZ-5 TaxID=3367526 RepID=UPI0037547AC7